jgi:hypothetical protein
MAEQVDRDYGILELDATQATTRSVNICVISVFQRSSTRCRYIAATILCRSCESLLRRHSGGNYKGMEEKAEIGKHKDRRGKETPGGVKRDDGSLLVDWHE